MGQLKDLKRKFTTPKELEDKINKYFDECLKKKQMPTKGGMALCLDTCRDTLGEYEKKENYSDTIKRAYKTIENAWVQKLAGQSVAGIIFYLKNAFKENWKDRNEVHNTGEITVKRINYGELPRNSKPV